MYKNFSQKYNNDLKEKYSSSQFCKNVVFDSFYTKRNLFIPANENYFSITKRKNIESDQDIYPSKKSF